MVESLVYRWGFEAKPDWTFLEILLLLSVPIVLYLASALVASVEDGSDPDLHFVAKRKPFLTLLALSTVLYSIEGFGVLFVRGNIGSDLIRLVALGIFAVLAATESRRTHIAGSLAYLALLLLFVFLYSSRLSDVQLVFPGT